MPADEPHHLGTTPTSTLLPLSIVFCFRRNVETDCSAKIVTEIAFDIGNSLQSIPCLLMGRIMGRCCVADDRVGKAFSQLPNTTSLTILTSRSASLASWLLKDLVWRLQDLRQGTAYARIPRRLRAAQSSRPFVQPAADAKDLRMGSGVRHRSSHIMSLTFQGYGIAIRRRCVQPFIVPSLRYSLQSTLLGILLSWYRSVRSCARRIATHDGYEPCINPRVVRVCGKPVCCGETKEGYALCSTMTAQPPLPFEIVAEIITNVDDTPTLLSCLLISRNLTCYAEPKLYKNVSLSGKQLKSFLYAIERNPQRAEHTVHLVTHSLHVPSSERDPDHTITNVAHYVALDRLLSILPNLTSFEKHARNDAASPYFRYHLFLRSPTARALKRLVWLNTGRCLPFLLAARESLEFLQLDRGAGGLLSTWQAAALPVLPCLRALRLPYPSWPSLSPAALGLNPEEWKRASDAPDTLPYERYSFVTWIRER